MRSLFLLSAFALANCAASATVSGNATATVPITTRDRQVSHEEHASQSCKVSADCESPLSCCFSTPEGGHLDTGYCATEEICAAVSAPVP